VKTIPTAATTRVWCRSPFASVREAKAGSGWAPRRAAAAVGPWGPTPRDGLFRRARRETRFVRFAHCARPVPASQWVDACTACTPPAETSHPGATASCAPRRPPGPRLCRHALASLLGVPRSCRRAAWGAGVAGRVRRRGPECWGRRAQRASKTDSPASCAVRAAHGAKWTACPQREDRSAVALQGRPPRSDRRARTPSRSERSDRPTQSLPQQEPPSCNPHA